MKGRTAAYKKLAQLAKKWDRKIVLTLGISKIEICSSGLLSASAQGEPAAAFLPEMVRADLQKSSSWLSGFFDLFLDARNSPEAF